MTEPEPSQLGAGADWPDIQIGPDTFDAIALTGTTPKGLPYPESTDPLNQGANAIKALALAVDATWTAGAGAPTGDATGRAKVAHGLGVTPRVVLITQNMLTPDGDNVIDMIARVAFSKADATNITVRFYDIRGNGAVFAGNPVGFAWLAIK